MVLIDNQGSIVASIFDRAATDDVQAGMKLLFDLDRKLSFEWFQAAAALELNASGAVETGENGVGGTQQADNALQRPSDIETLIQTVKLRDRHEEIVDPSATDRTFE